MTQDNHEPRSDGDNSRRPGEEQAPDEAAVEYAMPDESAGFALAEKAAFWLFEKKGEDVVVIDLRGRSDVCDFFVIGSGQSDVQVKALGRSVQDHLFAAGQKPTSSEGLNEGRWILLDYFDVVVHIFRPEAREYYRIEALWGDAPRLEIDPACFTAPEVRRRHPELPVVEVPASADNLKEPDPS